jgi:hypothetical protein
LAIAPIKPPKKRGVTKSPTPKAPKPWDRRSGLSPPSPDAETLFLAVGRALTAWETFEAHLELLFERLLRVRERVILVRAYGTIVSFKTRLEMIQAAMVAHLTVRPDDQLAVSYKAFHDAADGFSGRRNDIAHGHVVYEFALASGYWLLPTFFATSKRKIVRVVSAKVHSTIPTYMYAAGDIDYYAGQFRVLTVGVDAIAEGVQASHKRRPKRR